MKIGLEVHVQLQTQTKLFCSCANVTAKEPNTLTCPTCLGMPGSKPVANSRAVEYAIRIGIALHCRFSEESFFSRKSYFYPDMSKNFQITQYEMPLAQEGWLVNEGKKIRIRRIQLEEDPARLVHVGGIGGQHVLADYNRSGTPLVEIVTEPDFSSPKEARKFLEDISAVLHYLGVFDPDAEASMRCDANISVSDTRVEIKNITGFREVEKALNYEIIRQNNVLRRKGKIERETRSWDDVAGVTKSMRTKEEEEDYGYIFESDLPGMTIDKERVRKMKASMPELPGEKLSRYVKAMKISPDIAASIVSDPDIAEMFEKVSKEADQQLAARWFAGEIKKTLNYNSLKLKDTGLEAAHIGKLLRMVGKKEITERSAELMLRELVLRPMDPENMASKKARIYDERLLEPVVEKTINENPQALLDYKAGRQEAFNFLVGQVMKRTEGRGDPDTIRKLLQGKIK